VSQLVPVRMFGAYGAVGVMLTFCAVMTFIPGVLSIWKPKGIARAGSVNLETGVFEGTNRFWTWLSRQIARHHAAIVGASVVAMVGLGWGIRGLGTSVHVRTLFGSDSRIVGDYSWIEQHVGALVPLEVVVEFGPRCGLSQADRYSLISQVQRQLHRTEHIKGTVSCANLMPDLSDRSPTDRAEMNKLLNGILTEARPYFVEHRYLHESHERQQWRVTGYISALEEIDYAEMLSAINRSLEESIATAGREAGVSLHVTGVMPLVDQIQRALMQDLFVSFLSAFVVIFVIMTIVQAGVWTALISMIPNGFPTILLFGLLGWLKWPLDIGSVMTASVALGIAVDDVLHFLAFYRRGLARGLSREEAVHTTYQQCGFAMFVSSLVCGLGPVVFYFSDFLPASRFAWMMLLLLTVAVAGDMILLPALVVGPLGRLFERQYPQSTIPPDQPTLEPMPAKRSFSKGTPGSAIQSNHRMPV
jgi:predicted RND superfamily exporter protein